MKTKLCEHWVGEECELGENTSFHDRMMDCVQWMDWSHRCPRNPIEVSEVINVHTGAGTYANDVLKMFPGFVLMNRDFHRPDKSTLRSEKRLSDFTDWSYQIVKEV